ncbi:MAG: FKBP-type peptidyl-prolyl cis-trans isomerase [Lentisphaerae bacterium]|jgi:FKBP-type peptidyl-prolyl cis-trans isomerase FklB|nr:FKBP-type peptidyl-prolyl cis-trans isomerase [Lentisphaerota bacterium]MBT5612699.1 FKBP-type peptidyl-prolyl cis-trans isomerase [Lentisphaerota bacterium]MBT7057573.1 FKBP-type peptidyl-prolyl cis-trans isomerase [Lentisphaerota bacterium]MBT7846168.1 FKBP-type peptidyl-prolyl cis-trans isomerase [Lentisphaerota bacterium]
MKTMITVVVATALTAGIAGAADKEMKSMSDKVSYLIGRQIGQSFARDDLGLDLDLVMKGLKEAVAGKESSIPDAEASQIMGQFQKEMAAKSAKRNSGASTENEATGKAFRDTYVKKDGVKTTPSGLIYRVIKTGDGKKPEPTDTVETHYKGTLVDGTEFDSSHSRGQPATFPVNGVIKGWQEALPMMTVGSKWELVIPADLAYGDRGAGPKIGPGSTLVFEIELLDIK